MIHSKSLLVTLALGGIIIWFAGCAKESEDRLAGTTTTCDTTSVSYSLQIVPILQTNCYACHGNGSTAGSGGINLASYANLKVYADNGYLVGNVTHAAGYVGMPYGLPPLPSCEQNTIVAWVNQGTKNN